MNRPSKPTPTLLRSAFFAVALTITVALGFAIDALALHDGPDGGVAARPATIVVAQAGS